MFLSRRPSTPGIERFLEWSRRLPLSYGPIGLVDHPAGNYTLDEQAVAIGQGESDFERACTALTMWRHFDLGWVEVFPGQAPIETGTVVAVLVRHLGFWSLNGARVVYRVGGNGNHPAFGFAYGTLTNHAEHGEELFEVRLDPGSGDVLYRIRAVSWPQSPLARIGLPIARRLQARFRRDSAAAMKRAVAEP
jgi:uncharacterized protein (UPF0548 family)